MSLALSYTIIAAAFLAVSAMAIEIVVRRRRPEQRPRWSGNRRIDPAAPVPPGRNDVSGRHRHCGNAT
jgi:heme/copper-type cytochrome/quinol oxidase subunit 2